MKTTAPSVILFAAFILLLSVGGCGSFSLAADVTPPPDYIPPTPAPEISLEAVPPTRPINIRHGKTIYLEKCAPCHGESGMGDGQQAGNLPDGVPALVTPSMVGAASPQDWYQVTVAGRMDRSMPAFTSLTPGQIWDVIGYIHSLGAKPEEVAAGQKVFDAECATCHGSLGKGDGPGAAGLPVKPPDMTNPVSLMALSQNDLIQVIASGKGTSMPSFAGQLNGEQISAVAAHLRGLGFSDTLADEAVSTASASSVNTEIPAELEPPIASGTPGALENEAGEEQASMTSASIRALITLPAGGVMPQGLVASLIAYDAMQPVFTIEKEVDSDNTAQWDGIEAHESRVYMVSVEHSGVTFRSKVIHGADLKPGEVVSAPVELFETTGDKSTLTAERVHIFFDFPSAERIQVVEMFLIANPGQAMVVPASENEAVIEFVLPPGYANLQFESGELGGRFIQTEAGFGDTASVQPGSASHQILFAYELPYQKSALIPLHLPLDVSNAILLVPGGGVKLEADGLQDAGARTLQEGDMHLYAVNDLAAGTTLEVRVSGLPNQSPVVTAGTTTGLYIGGGALALVLIGTAVWLLRRKNPEEDGGMEEETEEESVESLLDAIIALDDLYQAGKLPGAAYQERREELKERLRLARER